MSRLSAQATIRDLALKSQEIVNSKGMSSGAKRAQLDALDAQLQAAQAELKQAEMLGRKSFELYGPGDGGSPAGAMAGGVPSFALDEAQLRELHEAVVSHKSVKLNASQIVAKAAYSVDSPVSPSAAVPPSYSGFAPFIHEPTRVAELLPQSANNAPSIEFVRHGSTTGAAGVTPPGGLKPAVSLVTERITSTARKIAATTVCNDEDLADLSDFSNYVGSELTRLVIDVENDELINGDGTGDHLLGILHVPGVIAVDNTGATPLSKLDVLQKAVGMLRTGAAKCSPTGIVMAAADWYPTVTAKNTLGNYLVGDPAALTGTTLWGLPVVLTSQLASGTCIVADWNMFGALHWRQGVTLQADFGQTGFEHNQTTFRAEERLGLCAVRPAALAVITGY